MRQLGLLGVASSWVALLSLGLAGCGREENAYVAPPPPEVTVAPPQQREVQDAWEFTGTVAAFESVDVRPRVNGYIEAIHFHAGDLVQPGEALFRIDPAPFEAQVAQARANVQARQADLRLAEVNVERVREIVANRAGTPYELSQREAEFAQAQANVALAEAALRAAELDLAWSEVKAPIRGRISRNLVDVGALVSPETVLASIVNDEQVYVYFNASEREMYEYLRMNPDTIRTMEGRQSITNRPVYITLLGETEPRAGRMDSADPAVDPDTGTIQARAIIDNPDRQIVAGSFVRVRLPKEAMQALLVPEVALSRDQTGAFLLVVNRENVVERRNVTLGATYDGAQHILTGIEPSDRVIINGLQRAQPGAEVAPVSAAEAPRGEGNEASADGA